MTLDEIRREITLALTPVQQSLESLHREQHGLAAQVGQQGRLLARLDERTVPPGASRSGGRLNGHAKTMGGAGMMAVVWALVEIIQTLIAAP